MDDLTKRDLLSKVNGQTRRRVIQSIGIGLTGIGAGVSTATAQSTENPPEGYDRRATPGNRDLNKNIVITNNSSGERTVVLQIRRITPGRENPVVFEREYTVPAPTEKENEFPNIVSDSTGARFGAPGEFVGKVQTDNGRQARVSFRNATGRIESNQSLSIRALNDKLELNYYRA